MADTERLSKETLEKHNQKSGQAPQQTDDGKKSDSASGQPGSGTGKSFAAARQRRMSRWRPPPPAGGGGGASRKLSAGPPMSLSSRDRHLLQRVENTYKMAPDPPTKFSVAKARAVTDDAIKHFLGGSKSYDPEAFSTLSKFLADDVKNRVKELGFARYKLVVHVLLGQLADQSMEVASRCVWDVNNDNMTTVTRQNGDMYVIASVFATYYE